MTADTGKLVEVKKAKVVDVAPGENQVLIGSDTAFDDILAYDKEGKHLVFDMLDFPEVSQVNLGLLSKQARMAYQMDLRNSVQTASRTASGEDPYESRIKVIASKDPLARSRDSMRSGQARTLPSGMKHLNVAPEDVSELEQVGYRKAKPGEVEIVGARTKSGAVVLQNKKGEVDNVTMLVDKDSYKAHRKADIARSEARVGQNIESTKEKLRRYDSRVTIFDESDMKRK